jgi:broad specificity phosphatase PhoE
VDRWSFDRVVLVRHGQTEWNVAGRRQGQLDSALTALGAAQAGRVAATLRGRSVDGVFTSPLGRALATANVCARALVLPVTVVDELAEVHHGDMAGMTTAEIEHGFPGELSKRATDKYTWRFPGGESYADADRRAGTALRRVAAGNARSPLLVSHEMIGRMLVRNLLDTDPMSALRWTHPHDVIYETAISGRDRPSAAAISAG